MQAAGALEGGLAQRVRAAAASSVPGDARARGHARGACTATSSSAPLPQTPHEDDV